MSIKKRILLKLTGEILSAPDKKNLNAEYINHIGDQIKQLASTHQFGLVIGGGNFFRGSIQGKQLNMRDYAGHNVGMLATVMNSMIVKDIFEQLGLSCTHFSAFGQLLGSEPISHDSINKNLSENKTVIFSGGTGNPFFTTDTAAIVRALQINAGAVWKGTNVDGVYTENPKINSQAALLPNVTYTKAINDRLEIMDLTAFSMAQNYNIHVRVFNIFKTNALIDAAHNENFGSTIKNN